ncbi:MAG: patatin-like phospholipase family protein [Ardenticatenaceae bacterium]|nr:patatin-like phospholipase family protein [Ardenticatenaceae bacterium]
MEIDLVFAGGGAKGIVHCGAVQALLNSGHQFGRLVGTSAGAITAVLLGAGFSAEEIVGIFTEKLPNGRARLNTLRDVPETFPDEAIDQSLLYALVRDTEISFIPPHEQEKFMKNVMHAFLKSAAFREIFSFVEFGGAYGGNTFLGWIHEELAKKSMAEATFAEFYEATSSQVTAVATDLDDTSRLVLNHITTPHLPVAWAIRMSMSIPLVWQGVTWQEAWGPYHGRDITGHTIVDGGVVSNLPLDLVLADLPLITRLMGSPAPNSHAIGLYIDTSLPVSESTQTQPPAKKDNSKTSQQLTQINQHINNLVDTFTRAHDRIVASTYPNNICRLPAKGYTTMDFDMSDERVQALVKAGSKAMQAYLENAHL